MAVIVTRGRREGVGGRLYNRGVSRLSRLIRFGGLRRRVTAHTDVRQFVRTGELGAETYWSKRYLVHPADAAKEYAFLRDASQALREWPALRVVEPVALENDDTLITRHSAGVSMAVKLRSADVTRAGEWLGRWHSATTVAGDARAAGVENWRVRVHGDYGPHNILVSGDDIVVLDPSFPEDLDAVGNIASPCEDLGRFCAYLRGAIRPDLHSPVADELTRSFLNGYNSVAARRVLPSSPMLLLCTARHLLRSMFDWKRRGTPARVVLRRFDRWFAAQSAMARRLTRPSATLSPQAGRGVSALLVGDQIDGPLQLLVAQQRQEVGHLSASDDALFALEPPIALDRVSEGEVIVVGSRWAGWAARRGVDVADTVLPMLRGRFNRVIGLDQGAGFQLDFDRELAGCFDTVIKSNGIYRDLDQYSPLPHATAAALHLGLPSFVTETLEARRLRRSLGTSSTISNAARSLADRLFSKVTGGTGIPPETAHFYGTLTHVQRADALRRLRARRIRVRGGIVGVPPAVCGLDGDGMSILDARRRAEVFRGLAAEGLTATPLSRTAYRLSMLRCKAVISIAGHGEICYRMAEAWAMRRVLVCQDLSHARTLFPFANGRNVVYCRPDLADLADILEDIEGNYRRYEPIAEQGRRDWDDWSARTQALLREAFAPVFA
jgi:hypothetical protein